MSDSVASVIRDKILSDNLILSGFITTAIIVVAIIGLRLFLTRLVKGKENILSNEQRRWINRINNGTNVILLIALLFVWSPQLHTFAISLTAFAVAVVLTTKELLMCITGGFLRASNKSFDIGDWISIDGMTGEVMQINVMSIAIEEVDTARRTYQYTGKTIFIPNSKFLSFSVENANFLRYFVYYDIDVTVTNSDLDPVKSSKELEKIVNKYFEPIKDEAELFNRRVEQKTNIDFTDPDPQYYLKTTDSGHSIYTVRMFIPTIKVMEISTNITKEFLSYIHKEKLKISQKAK